MNPSRYLAAIACAAAAFSANAQSASGNSATDCRQSGNQLICTTTTTVNLPSGTNLTGMSIQNPTQQTPACTHTMDVSPTSVTYGVPTNVTFSLRGCPTTGYTYRLSSPLNSTTSTAQTVVTLSANQPSFMASATVCQAAAPTQCQTLINTVTGVPPALPQALSVCTISPAAPSVSAGGSVNLSASCTTGTGQGSGATYQWTRNGVNIPGATSASYSVSATETATPGTFTYGVSIQNSAPSWQTAAVALVVTPNGNTTNPSTDACPAYPVRAVVKASDPYVKIYTSRVVQTLGDGDNFVVQIDVDANDTTVGGPLAGISFSDFGANRGGRWATLSRNKCDYSDNGAQWITSNFLGEKYPNNAGSASVAVNSPTQQAQVRMTTGTWYLNIQNVPGTCPAGQSCHAVIQWSR